MKFKNSEQSSILICASIILHIGASSDSDILKSLKIEYSVADKNDYSFFPVVGGDLTIPCHTSDGHPQIPLWYKDKMKVNFNKKTKVHYAFSNPRMVVTENGSLTIRNMILQDAGLYICKKRQLSEEITIITKAFVTFLATSQKSTQMRSHEDKNVALSSNLQSSNHAMSDLNCSVAEFHIDNKTENKCDGSKPSNSNMYEREVFIVLLSFFVLMVVLVSIILLCPNLCMRRKTRKKRTTDCVEASYKMDT